MTLLDTLKVNEKSARLLVDKFDGTVSDSDGDFHLRNTNRIDVAQVMAEEYLNSSNIVYKNIGFDSKNDRIPSQIWFKVPEFLRCMPDMFIVVKNQFNFLEIKGCTESAKFKIDDLNQYNLWNGVAPVLFFIYSNTLDERFVMRLQDVWNMIDVGEIHKYNDNNKKYLELPCTLLNDFKRKKK